MAGAVARPGAEHVVAVVARAGRSSSVWLRAGVGQATEPVETHAGPAGRAEDRYTVSDVADLLGFAAASAFSRWFRRRFGTSPGAWRRAARQPHIPVGR